MAKATVVCGSCGAPVAREDTVCSQCGSELSWQDPSSVRLITCKACGHGNPAGARFCLSCGTKLERDDGQKKPVADEKPVARKKERLKETAGAKKKVEIWQIVSLFAFLALVAFLIYNEASRQSSRIATGTPGNTPTQTPRAMVDLTPLEQAVAANPGDPGSVLHLANGLQDNGLYPRAIEMYKKYLAMRPKDPDARVDLGICYYQLGVADKANSGRYYGLAIGEMQQAHTDKPSHQPAVFHLGVVSLQLGNLKEANQWFQLAATMNPSSELGKRAEQMLKEHQFPQ